MKHKPPTKTEPAAPTPRSGEYPYVHVGHGVSAARKDWSIAVVLRDPIDARVRAALKAFEPPSPLDGMHAELDARAFTLGHDSDSLQWVVAAAYPGAGPRADKGEATSEQWQAFNADLDGFLARVHAQHPIAAVVRTVDDEYSTDLSDWHPWSCRELPRFLPFVAAALAKKTQRWFLEHACDLWRDWLGQLALAEQEQALAELDAAARAVLDKTGGVPEATEPAPPPAPPPSLDDQKQAWAAIPADADAVTAFAAAFARVSDDAGDAWDLHAFRNALSDAKDDPLLVDVTRRALASPSCEWPDTHWRPELVEALLRLGRIDEARAQLGRVVLGATSYIDASWLAIISYLDATNRPDDGDVIFRVAQRYTASFDETRARLAKKPPKDQKARAATLLADLAAPALADLDALDEEALDHGAFLFEDLVEEDVAGDALLAPAKRMREHGKARKARQVADGFARLARGEQLDESALRALIKESRRALETARPEDADRMTRVALAFPALIPELEAFAYHAKDSNLPVALAVYRLVVATPPPADGDARTSWLQTANSALVVTHEQKLYAESARLADELARYARENPYITHSAACSYAAVERYDDALAMVKLAVELDYDHLDKVKVDKDLGPLLKRPEFKALFKRR